MLFFIFCLHNILTQLYINFLITKHLFLFLIHYFTAELGDYDARKHAYGYVSEFRFIANQTRELEQRISEIHQKLKGMSPNQSELNYLDKVKWHDMFGVDLHPVLVRKEIYIILHYYVLHFTIAW